MTNQDCIENLRKCDYFVFMVVLVIVAFFLGQLLAKLDGYVLSFFVSILPTGIRTNFSLVLPVDTDTDTDRPALAGMRWGISAVKDRPN